MKLSDFEYYNHVENDGDECDSLFNGIFKLTGIARITASYSKIKINHYVRNISQLRLCNETRFAVKKLMNNIIETNDNS